MGMYAVGVCDVLEGAWLNEKLYVCTPCLRSAANLAVRRDGSVQNPAFLNQYNTGPPSLSEWRVVACSFSILKLGPPRD